MDAPIRKSLTEEINGHTYQVTAMGAISGRALMVRIMPCLAAAFASGGKAQGLADACEKLDEGLLTYLCDKLAETTQVTANGTTQNLKRCFDQHFSANYAEMVSWLVFALRVNFEDVFAAAASQFAEAPAAVQVPAK